MYDHPFWRTAAILSLGFGLSSISWADIQGHYFSHHDWEIACDNTGTCRAAGYQSEKNFEKPLSVLFERAAGNAEIKGILKIDEHSIGTIKSAVLLIQNRSYAAVQFNPSSGEGRLSTAQTQALLKAVQGSNKIEVKADKRVWQLSTQGATAVLLKMDDVQKRVGTPSAIVGKGTAKQAVLAAEKIPTLWLQDYRRGTAQHLNVNSAAAKNVFKVIRPTTHNDDCEFLFERDFSDSDQVTLYPINAQFVLAEVPCWRAAYNQGYGYWLMDKLLKKVHQQVTTRGSSFSDGQIFSSQKGRGIADCIAIEEWAWNGKAFVRSYAMPSGQCKGFSGGAWNLPIYISEVKMR